MQFNYSYNNDGAGYLLAEYDALFPFSNNVVDLMSARMMAERTTMEQLRFGSIRRL